MYFCLDQSKSALLPSISRRDHSRGHISGFTSGLKGWSYEKSNIKCDTWFTNALQFTGKPEEMAQRVEFFRTTCEYLWSTKGVSFLAKEEVSRDRSGQSRSKRVNRNQSRQSRSIGISDQVIDLHLHR